jgi:LCP family protein required for cell wall assembly
MSITDSSPPARRRLPRWLKVSLITLLVVANLAVIAAIWAVQTGRGILASAGTNAEVTGVLDQSTGDGLTFLIVGSDSRAGLDDLTNFGPAGGERSDVVILARLDPGDSNAQMLSIPRDLWVDIPGHGENRINAAYAFGGPSLMVETIRQNLNVTVNHYIEIDFSGFQALVDGLGGIELTFPYPARDSKSGLDVSSGTQTVDGKTALAYARSRNYQELQGGSWVSVEANDIGRTQRQQEVIRAILSELRSPSSIAEAGSIASAMAEHMTIDSGLAGASVANLAWDYKGILTGSIAGATLPTEGATREGRSVVVAADPEAGEMLANFKSGAELTAQPVRVEVLNGNGVSGAAGSMAQDLEDRGFVVVSIGDAERDDYDQTTVIVPAGSDDGAKIVSALGFGVVQTGDVDNGFDAVVIVGADST